MASALSQIETMKQLQLQKPTENEQDNDIDMNQNGNKSKKGGMDVDKDTDNNNTEQKRDENENEYDENTNKLSQELVTKITESALELAKARKKETKKVPLSLVSMDKINGDYGVIDNLSYIAHSESDPGINCMKIDYQYGRERIISGGNDCQLIIYNGKNKKFEYVIKGHSKRINDCLFHPKEKDIVLSASSDNSCIIWKLLNDDDGKYKQLWNNNIYNDRVLSLSIHPLNEYFLSCSLDGFWYFHSMKECKTLLKGGDGDNCKGYNCMELHPDGQILAIGSNNKKLKIWDIRTNEIGYTFDLNDNNISCINFNENGYYLGSGNDDGIVNIWDLRKIGKNKDKQFLKQINIGNRIKCIQFDKTGQYLAVGQPNGISLYLSKKWTKFASFDGIHKKDVTSIQFAKDAKFIVTASRDRNIKFISDKNIV